MVAYGVDEAWQRLTPSEMKAAGKTFVVGYVSENASKNVSAAEAATYHAAGIAVLLVYEYSTTAAESGAAGGARNAALAVAQARALGYPQGCAIAFAIDEGSPNLGGLAAYARAFTNTVHAAGYRSMVYGGLATVRHLANLHLVDLLWQTYAWSHGQWDSRVSIKQVRNGVRVSGKDVDLDTALVDDYGAWMPEGTTGVNVNLADPVRWTATPGKDHRTVEELLADVWNVLLLNKTLGGALWNSSPLYALGQVAAKLDAVTADVHTLAASGGSPDVAPVVAAIQDLRTQVDDLTAKLAAAGHALGG